MGKLLVNKLHPDAIVPTIVNPGEDLGFDLFALEDTFLYHGQQQIVKTGIAAKYVEAPQNIPWAQVDPPPGCIGYSGGWYNQSQKYGLKIFDRSSMAAKFGVLTMAGVIDAGYDGEIGVVMILLGPPMTLHPDLKLAEPLDAPKVVQAAHARRARITAEPWTEQFLSTLTDWDRELITYFQRDSKQVGYQIKRGDRIAQIVPVRVYEGAIEVVDELPKGRRGGAGYGSSGK